MLVQCVFGEVGPSGLHSDGDVRVIARAVKVMDVLQVLNQELPCDRCQARGSWVAHGRPEARLNSRIHRLRCTQCGEQIAAKVVGGDGVRADGCAHLRAEYDTLRTLRLVFPEDSKQGTLEPLHYFVRGSSAIMITRWLVGDELGWCARRSSPDSLYALYRPAGTWLRSLHGCDTGAPKRQSLEVMGKLRHLAREYARVFDGDAKIQAARDLLADVGAELDPLALPAARLHGDFKPGNMLCAGQRYIGLDIQWRTVGAVAYDLASFLNHAWLAERGTRVRKWRQRSLEGFLDGYGDYGDPRPLQWVRLYFALCHLGSYRLRGIVATRYAGWKVWPLVRELADQLRRTA